MKNYKEKYKIQGPIKFKAKGVFFGEQSQSSSEDREDGLLTATDVIKQEIKKLENRLSEGDLTLENKTDAQLRSFFVKLTTVICF